MIDKRIIPIVEKLANVKFIDYKTFMKRVKELNKKNYGKK